MITTRTSDSPSAEFINALFSKPKRKARTVEHLEAIVSRGMAEGWCKPLDYADLPGRHRRHFLASCEMDCEDPYEWQDHARYDRKGKLTKAIFVTYRTRCRVCGSCRERRAMFWQARAMTEFNRWPNTYMVTLTLRPEMHYFFDAAVHGAMRPQHALEASSGCLAPATLYAYRARVIGSEVTKYLKRLRSLTGRMRYLLVAEAHKSQLAMRPHFHLLIHEMEAGTVVNPMHVTKERGWCSTCNRPHEIGEVCEVAPIRSTWDHGFTKVMLGDSKTVFYLCKYVSKELGARVRASQLYGAESFRTETLSELDLGLSTLRVREKEIDPKKENILFSEVD